MNRRLELVVLVLLVVACAGCVRKASTIGALPEEAPPPPQKAAPSAGPPPAEETSSETPDGDAVPRLLPEPGSVTASSLVRQLDQLEQLSAQLRKRSLTDAQREQLDAGAAFVQQSRRALEEHDVERAAILAEKGGVLIEDLDEATRP